MKYFAIIIIFIILFAFTTNADAPCRSDQGGYCVRLLAQASAPGIPGLEFLRIPNDAGIGQVLSYIYIFGLSLVGISSLIMMILGGIMYMTAGDSQSRSGQGKTFISNALYGLIIALISWLILYTINPDLVKTLSPNIDPILDVGEGLTGALSRGTPCIVGSNQCADGLNCILAPGTRAATCGGVASTGTGISRGSACTPTNNLCANGLTCTVAPGARTATCGGVIGDGGTVLQQGAFCNAFSGSP